MSRPTLALAALLVLAYPAISVAGGGEVESAAYDSLIAAADEFYEQEAYGHSTDAYAKAFLLPIAPDPTDLYNAACSASLSGQIGRAFGFLHSAVDAGWRHYVNAGIDPDLKLLRARADLMAEVRARVDRAVAAEAGENFDAALASELTDVYIRDQGIRYELGELQDQYPEGVPDSIQSAFDERWLAIDEANQNEVVGIIDERGWPRRSEVGNTGAIAVFLVVQHAPLEVQETYLPMLERAVKEDEARPADLALLTDRVRMRRGEPQLYGSQVVRGEEGDWVFHPIEDPEHVDDRRRSVGLGPIADYAARMGVSWPPPEEH